MRPKRRWRDVLLLFLGLFLAYGGMCWYLAGNYLHPKIDPAGSVPPGLAEARISLPTEVVNAWETPTLRKAAPETTFVLVHGYGGNQSSWGVIAADLAKAGYGVIVPTLPGHNDSSDDSTGFGLKEARRLTALVEALRAAPGPRNRKIILVGVSMGGAASWLATEMGAKVDGVVSEGAFGRLEDAMDTWFDHVFTGGRYVLRPVVWIARAQSGLNPADVVPVRAAEKWKGRPALVIQGDEDRHIPMFNAEALSKAADCELWIVSGARHAQCSDVAHAEYVHRLESFAVSIPLGSGR